MLRKLITTCLISPVLLTMANASGLNENNNDLAIPELDCVMEPSEVVDVGSAVPGLVETIHADRSDLVKKGEVVVKMESSVEWAAMQQAKVRAGLDTSIKLREETANFGHLTQKRNQALFKKSAISIQDMDQLKTETRIAELQVKQEKENKRIAELEYQRAKSIFAQRSIRSPVNGVIMDRFKAPGEFVNDEPVLRVAQLDPLHIEVIVPVEFLGQVTTGMQAEVTSVVPGADTHVATVERVDLVADAASGTYGVRLNLANPDYSIPAGMRCNLSFLPPEQNEFEEVAEENNSENEGDLGEL